jgi:hypothetical protein
MNLYIDNPDKVLMIRYSGLENGPLKNTLPNDEKTLKPLMHI